MNLRALVTLFALGTAGCFSGRPLPGAYKCGPTPTFACPSGFYCDMSNMTCQLPDMAGAAGGGGAGGGGVGGGGGVVAGTVDVGGSCTTNSDCQTENCDNTVCELATGPPGWVGLHDMTFKRQRPAVLLLANGTIMAAGGGYVGNDINNSVEVFVPPYLGGNKWQDISGNTMAPYAPMVFSNQSAAAGIVGGTLYIAGGLHNEQTLESYDGTAKKFNALDPTITSGQFIDQAGSAVSGGKLYVFGGYKDATTIGGNTESFDGSGWSTLGLLMTPRRALAGVVDPTGLLYALGGHGAVGNDKTLDVVETYVSSSSQWQKATALATPREDFGAAFGADGRLYVVGGLNGGATMPTVEAQTIARSRWAKVSPLGTPTSGLGVATGADGLIYAIGGADATGAPLQSAAVYGPQIILSPTTLTGSNFAAHANVAVYDGKSATGTPIGTGTTDDLGALTAPIMLSLAKGSHVITAIDDHSRYPISTPFTVQ